MLVNRAKELLGESYKCRACTVKLMRDLLEYSLIHPEIPCFFFSNDVRVLLDIILREISDMDDGDLKLEYIELLYSITRHPLYLEDRMKRTETRALVKSLIETNDQEMVSIAQRIWKVVSDKL